MKAQISIDWCTFSVKGMPVDAVIRDYLGIDPALFREESYGLMGFKKMKHCNHIMVCYDPLENEYFHDQGVCVSMSGSGCRAFETLSKFSREDNHGMKSSAFPALFALLGAGLDDKKTNVSRIDLACDDRAGHLEMETLVDKVQTNEINSRISKRTVMQQWDGKERSGATVYIGAPSSDFRVRIYDKALEQELNDAHWIRVEMVMRSKHACNFVRAFNDCARVGQLAAQIANGKFSFIEMDDSNISRCSVCDWWAAFIDDLEALNLVCCETAKHSVERTMDWLKLQVAPSMAAILKTFGFAALWEIAKEGEERLTGSQLAMINDYNQLRAFNRASVAAL